MWRLARGSAQRVDELGGRGRCGRRDRLRGHDAAVDELDDPVGDAVVAVVVADHDHRLAAPLERRQDLAVEDLLEGRILVGRPFVEQVDRPVVESAPPSIRTLRSSWSSARYLRASASSFGASRPSSESKRKKSEKTAAK